MKSGPPHSVFFSPDNFELSSYSRNDLMDKFMAFHKYEDYFHLNLGLGYESIKVNHIAVSKSYLALSTSSGLRIYSYENISEKKSAYPLQQYFEQDNIVSSLFLSDTKILVAHLQKIKVINLSSKTIMWKSPSIGSSIIALACHNTTVAVLVSNPIKFTGRAPPQQGIVMMKLGTNMVLNFEANGVKAVYFDQNDPNSLILIFDKFVKTFSLKSSDCIRRILDVPNLILRSLQDEEGIHLFSTKSYYELSHGLVYESRYLIKSNILHCTSYFNKLLIPCENGIKILPKSSKFYRKKILNFEEILNFCAKKFEKILNFKLMSGANLIMVVKTTVDECVNILSSYSMLPDDFNSEKLEILNQILLEKLLSGDEFDDVELITDNFLIEGDPYYAVEKFNDLIICVSDNHCRVVK